VYAWLWHKLPFGLWGKLTGTVVLAAAVGVLLWYVVFPWATPILPFDDVQVGTGNGNVVNPVDDDPNAVPSGDSPGLGPDEIPYSTQSNAPAPTRSR
jgi:hypothetical protein